MTKIQAVRGMNDLLPQQSKQYKLVVNALNKILISYGYNYIRTPIVEKTQTFKRAIGNGTDIVSKEMYSWQDNKNNLSLRPEGTASIVRAMIEHNLTREGIQKVFYCGPMFRHERPQKGRYREFFQFGAEVFADDSVAVDIEIIDITNTILKEFKINATLEINSLGSKKSRDNYKQDLVKYLQSNYNKLDNDSIKKLDTNPLRILDSKNPDLKELINKAPRLIDYLKAEELARFKQIQEILSQIGINYKLNYNLVRGLDYYNDFVFEWTTDELGAQGTICAGGRYDGLCEIMGGNNTPAIGFAIGIERLLLLAKQQDLANLFYIISSGIKENIFAIQIANTLRKEFDGIILHNDLSKKSFKNKLKKANKNNTKYVLIIGEDELKEKKITFKFMQEDKAQLTLKLQELINFLHDIL